MTLNNSASFETPNRSGNYVNRSYITSQTSPITPIPSLILNQTDNSIDPQRGFFFAVVRRQQRPQRPNAIHPPTTNIIEKILVYETLHRNCVSQYYATVKALRGVSQKFIDSPDELTYTEKVAFEFTSIPLYAPIN
ncbi:hypothetical protein DDB_G0267204 [Dictyostelium discoideum AX4]|uniref:Uncharacterized protein n=1 Tax=Dictyostelium discoideum TaxID=44689 RepID=Q55H45_DICDI|nr:hypothetical protein DDB_G0267204 [Dictyostelium discoideum AX4]EAL73839.1 hypothetical protein DDB_G0267204 [Dictyostelium discoideum AX4]|eukprot:XP_647763.1 hypothetical protein DDB_G0267204 [Dictyostelium discoideum AX4]